MDFVGRKTEIRKLSGALQKGHNVIITGPYGIGRTRLVRHVAELNDSRRFVWVDFSKTAGEVCKRLLKEFLPNRRSSKQAPRSLSFKAGRYLLVNISFPDRQRPVVVMDNIGKLSQQQLTFIRCMILESCFRFVAVVESFLSPHSLFLLRAMLFPVEIMTLRHLSLQNACEYFKRVSEKHHFEWTCDQIMTFAKTSGGYPLGMKELAQRKQHACPGNAELPPNKGREGLWKSI
jgi:hypothetical protein